jgi:ankyrin repeat protein
MRDRVVRAIGFLALVMCSSALQAKPVADGDALARAIRDNDVVGVQTALAKHADPNQRLAFGTSPLALAVNTQNPVLVEALLAKRASPNIADVDGVTPLALACELGNARIVTQLLDAHADVRAAGTDGSTPLAICARYGPPAALAQMLAAGAAADSIDKRGQTPLMWAASSGRVEAIALLVKAGADVNRASIVGFTPLFFAIKSGVVPATETLLADGAKADYRGPENTSAAQLAAYQHNFGAAALMVARGADVNERDRTGYQLLHAAVAGGDIALVSLLLSKGADPNGLSGPSRIKWVTEANFGMPPSPVPPTPPLLIAAANGHLAVMKLLLSAGADPRFVAADGTNIVIAAVQGNSAPTLDFALGLAPNANVADINGVTPLHMLVGGGLRPDLEAMMRILAAHGARTDLKTKRGTTAAMMANDGLTPIKAMFLSIFSDQPSSKFATAHTFALPVVSN